MIIFGTRGLTSTDSTGLFHCPRCGFQRTYSWKRVNRWFTLYFIPVIPLGAAGEYVECTSCAGTFGIEAVNYNPHAERDVAFNEMKRIFVLAALTQQLPDSVRASLVQDAYLQVTGVALPVDEVQRDIEAAQSAGAQLAPHVERVADTFTDQGKQVILDGAYVVLSRKGAFTSKDKELLRLMGEALQVPQSRLTAFLDQYPA